MGPVVTSVLLTEQERQFLNASGQRFILIGSIWMTLIVGFIWAELSAS
jgi:hypothetical protein